jgi:hypothetical protein
MSDEQPKKVRVEALESHTAFGASYAPGDVYEVDEQFVDTVVVQRKAKRVDVEPAPAPKPSQPVEPMGTETFKKPAP